MKAVGIYAAHPINIPGALVDIEIPRPTILATDILVYVEAVSVNPADYRARLRKADDGNVAILGWDIAGTIVEVGSEVTDNFQIGDKVFYAGDISRPGGNSELHAVDYRIVGHRPKSITSASAACLPLVSLTAWEALFEHLSFNLASPPTISTLLIVGGAGGVGSLAIQLAKLIPNLTVIATASRSESNLWCKKLGADIVINHSNDLSKELQAIGIKNIDTALMLNDPDSYLNVLSEIIVPQGKICCIVPLAKDFDLNIFMRKSISFHWELMFTKALFQTPTMQTQSQILNQISTLIDEGKIISPITQEIRPINAKNLTIAHQLIESKSTIGKIALQSFFDE